MKIIDCEASSLSLHSYPIQIAWVDVRTSEQDCFYIKPSPNWEDWDIKSQQIHNIPQKLLYDIGISVDEACQRLQSVFEKENDWFCDAPDCDNFWIGRLFIENGLEDFQSPVRHIKWMLPTEAHRKQLQSILSFQDKPHDALDDCKLIKKAYHQVLETFKYDD